MPSFLSASCSISCHAYPAQSATVRRSSMISASRLKSWDRGDHRLRGMTASFTTIRKPKSTSFSLDNGIFYMYLLANMISRQRAFQLRLQEKGLCQLCCTRRAVRYQNIETGEIRVAARCQRCLYKNRKWKRYRLKLELKSAAGRPVIA